jgi:DNA repair protein RecN (Recombination protein N)
VRLARFEIEDFALIARASLEFADGFTVCTGETGSGKTMLLGALGFALGERSSADIVRAGAARARVTLEIELDHALRERLREAGLDDDAESAVFAREMLASGKSTARINGRLVTSSQLREFGSSLIETVGQHEQQRLLSHAYQLDVLDAFAGDDALTARARVSATYERLRDLEREVRDLADSEGRALAELEFVRFALGEIDEVAPLDGEDVALRERRDYLANIEKIAAALANAHEALSSGEASAVESLGAAATGLAAIARFAPDLGALAAAVAALQSDATEAAVAISRELESAEFDPAELEAVTARLDAVERLKKKYGGSNISIAEMRARFEETVALETSRDDRQADLRAAIAGARGELSAAARSLSVYRANAARLLEERVATELAALAMPSARFAVVLDPLESIGPVGAESAAFALSPNPGEPVRPLARAASGGELSRVLLALVVTVAERRERTALVFDEIDAGIGGATATAVGVRLGALALHSQVLCVTHLAQIATWADRHYALRKSERHGQTIIELVSLDDRSDSLEEIARMLSGSSAGVAFEHAESLVREVAVRKTAKSKTEISL